MKSNNFHAWLKKKFQVKINSSIDFVFFATAGFTRVFNNFLKKAFFVVFDEIFKKLTYIAYLYQFFALFEICYDFWILESRIPGFQKSPGIGQFWLISIHRVYVPLNFSQGTWFSMQNLKITSFLETSRNFLELWILPWNWPVLTDFNI